MTEPYRFSTPVRVRFNETDLQGHVNFAWYLIYFDVGLIEYMRTLGYSYSQMVAEGLDMLYVDSHTSYHSSAYFDEVIRVHCRLGHIGNTSMRFDFQVFAEGDGRLVATGEISAVVIVRESRDKQRVPEALRRAVQAYELTSGKEAMEAQPR